jgi:hypothetical protein
MDDPVDHRIVPVFDASSTTSQATKMSSINEAASRHTKAIVLYRNAMQLL